MTSRRNPKLKEFVNQVRDKQAEEPLLAAPDGTFGITNENAIAAADYIDARLSAASKGGSSSQKPKPGRPITKRTKTAELNRARVRRHREKNQPK